MFSAPSRLIPIARRPSTLTIPTVTMLLPLRQSPNCRPGDPDGSGTNVSLPPLSGEAANGGIGVGLLAEAIEYRNLDQLPGRSCEMRAHMREPLFGLAERRTCIETNAFEGLPRLREGESRRTVEPDAERPAVVRERRRLGWLGVLPASVLRQQEHHHLETAAHSGKYPPEPANAHTDGIVTIAWHRAV